MLAIEPAAGDRRVKEDDKVPPGEAKPIPPGEAKPIPKSDDDPLLTPPTDTKTDDETLPVLPTLSAPTGDDKYEAAMAKAFLLMAEKKDKEALCAQRSEGS